jgi:hypothetical protein
MCGGATPMVKIYTVKVVAAKLNNQRNNNDKRGSLRCGGDDFFSNYINTDAYA